MLFNSDECTHSNNADEFISDENLLLNDKWKNHKVNEAFKDAMADDDTDNHANCLHERYTLKTPLNGTFQGDIDEQLISFIAELHRLGLKIDDQCHLPFKAMSFLHIKKSR